MWYINKLDYYTAIKRNEVLIHSVARTHLENIMLSEKGQTQKSYMINLYKISIVVKSIADK